MMPVVVILLYIALFTVLAADAGIILWRIVRTRRVPVFVCLFLIMPAGQLLMLYSLSYSGWTVYWLAGLALSVAADILLLIYAVMQEKKAAVEQELREIRHRREMERAHYEAVAQRRRQLDEIRHGFNEKLNAVAKLARTGEDEEACASIYALAAQIDSTRERPYCAIPVINAVLTQKEYVCETSRIELAVDLDLPDALAVEPMHLCSIFSNLLDNAIAACEALPGADKPVIRLSSKMDGDYLCIKTTNPSARPAHTPKPGRGYGLRILSELAKQYEGGFRSDYRDGVFTSVAVLLAAGG